MLDTPKKRYTRSLNVSFPAPVLDGYQAWINSPRSGWFCSDGEVFRTADEALTAALENLRDDADYAIMEIRPDVPPRCVTEDAWRDRNDLSTPLPSADDRSDQEAYADREAVEEAAHYAYERRAYQRAVL